MELNTYSNAESPCHPDTSHQVSVQSNLQFGRRCGFKNFKLAAICHLRYQNRTILAILNLCNNPMPTIVSAQSHFWVGRHVNPTYRSVGDNNNFEDFQDCPSSGHLGHNKLILAILNLHVTPIQLTNQEQMCFEDFQDGRCGCHLR